MQETRCSCLSLLAGKDDKLGELLSLCLDLPHLQYGYTVSVKSVSETHSFCQDAFADAQY